MSEKDPNPFRYSPQPPTEIHPFVRRLQKLVGEAELNQAVSSARATGVAQLHDWGISTGDDFLKFATRLLYWVPFETEDAKEVYNVLCVFYFVLDQPAIKLKQTPIEPQSIDAGLSGVSQWMVTFANKIGDFHDTTASLTPAAYETFKKAPKYNVTTEALEPPGGFKTFNQFFSRHLKDGMRPIDGPTDHNIIVFPADSTYDGCWDVADNSLVEIKGLHWPIDALLESSAYKDAFAGGIWMHSFLNTFDYHRQHAPVKGKVVEAKVIQGQTYLNVEVQTDKNGRKRVMPGRSWRRGPTTGHDGGVGAGTGAGAGGAGAGAGILDAPDDAGYQFLQTRGCVVIDSPTVGLVAVLPIGMAQVSSVKLSVQDAWSTGAAGLPCHVEKGDEISCFQFGGSDIVLVFQANRGVRITAERQHYVVGKELARVEPK